MWNQTCRESIGVYEGTKCPGCKKKSHLWISREKVWMLLFIVPIWKTVGYRALCFSCAQTYGISNDAGHQAEEDFGKDRISITEDSLKTWTVVFLGLTLIVFLLGIFMNR